MRSVSVVVTSSMNARWRSFSSASTLCSLVSGSWISSGATGAGAATATGAGGGGGAATGAGAAAGQLKPVQTVAKNGFETPIRVKKSAAFYAVKAIGRTGKVLGTSEAVAPQP